MAPSRLTSLSVHKRESTPPGPPPKDPPKEDDKKNSINQYKNFFFTQNAFTQAVVPRPVVQELIHIICHEIKARGKWHDVYTYDYWIPFDLTSR